MWIYEQSGWPTFSWKHEDIAEKLASVRYQQGQLIGKMEFLDFDLKQDSTLQTITEDVIHSSAIEGEVLNTEDVHSSVAKHLGMPLDTSILYDKHVDGIVEIMVDATQNYSIPLTEKRLFNWHAALFPTGRSGIHPITVGNWRQPGKGPMQVVSGQLGKEKVHFEAPKPQVLQQEMSQFLTWFEHENDMDLILKAAIAHLWFITLHPFDDGNGRIARAITDMALARADGTRNRFYSLSTHIEQEKKAYYHHLEIQQKGSLDITLWLSWFLDTFEKAIQSAEHELESILFQAEFWKQAAHCSLNSRQKTILQKMLDPNFKGHIHTAKYAKLAKCSNDTALRDLQALKAMHILVQNPSGGRSISYRLTNTPYNIQSTD